MPGSWVSRRERRAAIAAAALVLLGAASAEAQSLRFETTQPGNVVAAGNTLGLSHAPGGNGPGIVGSIGTFLSLDPASVDDAPLYASDPWGPGTTRIWTENGSQANLVLPGADASVLYAELVWGASYRYGGENVTPYLDVPVTLAFGEDAISVAPDASTASTLDYVAPGLGTDARYYSRSADVTEFVKSHRAGFYAVSGVPATQAISGGPYAAAGWSLLVAYRRDGDPIRTMSLLVGSQDTLVDVDAAVDYPAYFCGPKSGVYGADIAFVTLEGDADEQGDQLLLAESALEPFLVLSGPNNPATNFFASQLNGNNGVLDTNGTYGAQNHDAVLGANTAGGRQGWDVTRLHVDSASGALAPDQRELVVRAATTGDTYLPLAAGIAVEIEAPRFSFVSSTATVSPSFPAPGDVVTLTATLVNEGGIAADELRFALELPEGQRLALLTVDEEPGDPELVDADLAVGVAVGGLAPGATRTIALDVALDPAWTGPVELQPRWSYAYAGCSVEAPVPETFEPRPAKLSVVEPASTSTAGSGEGGSDGTGGATTTGDQVVRALGGCTVAMPYRARDEAFGSIIALVGALISALRRRRP